MPKKRRMDAHIYFGSFVTFREIETVRVPLLEGNPVVATHLFVAGDSDHRALCGMSLAQRQQAAITTADCQLCWLVAQRLQQEGLSKPLLAPWWKPYVVGGQRQWSYRFV